MEYLCGVCKTMVEGDLVFFKDHTETHIVELIKHDHPEWVQSDGACHPCLAYYRNEMKGSFFKDVPCAIRNRKIKSFLEVFKNIFRAPKK